MKKTAWLLAATLILAVSSIWIIGCKRGGKHDHSQASAAETKRAKYHCPMHPTYVSDKPGECPICHMSLVPIESDEAHEQAVQTAQADPSDKKPLYYRHPMRPDVTSPVPKKDEMGMDYVPVYKEETEQAASGVSGQAPVKLTPEREQLIGVRTAPVEKQNLAFLVRASGRVAYDPDLYNAIAEYKEAVRAQEKTKDSPWPDVHERSEALVRSSVLRLRQMGLSEGQIANLAQGPDDSTNLLLGKTGGSVWVYAQIYEYETGLVKPGQEMEVSASALAGRRLWGKVVAVDPILNAETRTLKVRAEVSNPEGLLRPEMYVDAIIHVELGRRLAVPEEAVLDTGTRQLVFVETGPGRYEPRQVELGHEAEDFREVRSGVKEGEKVVISANFLVDSESKLKAAISQSSGGGHKHGQ